MHIRLCFASVLNRRILVLSHIDVGGKKCYGKRKFVYDNLKIIQTYLFKVISAIECSHWCALTMHSFTF